MDKEIKISGRPIGRKNSTFIIAELSANHNHDFEVAAESIKAAKDIGVDAIKLQTYTPDTITLDCSNKYFKIQHDTIWDGKTLYELYKEAYTPWEWQPKLKKLADEIGLICFSSPFDYTSVDFLENIKMPAYKIASCEITDIPLIRYIASKHKPIIISTGIARLEDIDEALLACKKEGNSQVILLKCTSEYPAPVSEANLKTIPDLSKRFDIMTGLSDHTMGVAVSIAAVVLGAKVIEKHFILNKEIGGPDAAFSLDKKEFKSMVDGIRTAEKAIGSVQYDFSERTNKSRTFCRSLFVTQDIKVGSQFTNQNIRSIRPGYGLPPKYLSDVIGKTSKFDLKRGTPLKFFHYK